MKPAPFDYAAPETVGEAVHALSTDDGAKVLAGGQSLMPLLNFRLAQPTLLVDLRGIGGLSAVHVDADTVTLGAMTRQHEAERDEIAERCPLLRAALRHVGHPQIRSRGTIGGSIAHADPAGELPAVLLALDGSVGVVGPRGQRTIAAADLVLGFFTTSIAPDEILVDVRLPAAAPGTGVGCVEVARRAGDYAICAALSQVTLEDGLVREARVAVFGVEDRAVRARAVEDALVGLAPDDASIRRAAADAADGLVGRADLHGSAEYRRQLAPVVTRRALAAAVADATQERQR